MYTLDKVQIGQKRLIYKAQDRELRLKVSFDFYRCPIKSAKMKESGAISNTHLIDNRKSGINGFFLSMFYIFYAKGAQT